MEEYVPIQFTIIDDGGAGAVNSNATHHTIKWLYLNETVPSSDRTISYILEATATGTFTFDGDFQFENTTDNLTESILGDTSFTIVNSPPVVTPTLPTAGFATTGHDITYACNASDNGDLDTLDLYVDYGSGYIDIADGVGDTDQLSIYTAETGIPYGTHNWYCEACDLSSDCVQTPVRSFTLNNEPVSYTHLTLPTN